MTDRKGLADLLEQRIKRLTIRPGEMATYCQLDADLDRRLLAALRQEPSVEATHETANGARFNLAHEKSFRDVVQWLAGEIEAAERGKATTRAQRKRFAKDEAINRLAQAISHLYRREP